MIVGIDLGTTRSAVAYLKQGKPKLIKDASPRTNGLLPSTVGIGRNGETLIGEPAANQAVSRAEFVVEEVKRLMGSDARVNLGAEEFSPQEISARILGHLKAEAEKHIGEPVTEVVITVPAYFNDRQRRATREAAEIAGLRCRRLINEPTAAALAYGIERPGVEEKILVYDLGGGTFDVTVLELSEGLLDILASTGNSKLGGKDFDECLMQLLRRQCLKQTGVDLLATRANEGKLRRSARRTKEDLSFAESADISLEFIAMKPDGEGVHFEHTVTRTELESLIEDLVESTRVQLDEALAEAELEADAIDTILLVGGSTRIPLVRALVSDYFRGRTLRTEIDPDTAVALGAAVLSGIEASLIDPEEIVITDVMSHTMGTDIVVEVDGVLYGDRFSPIIPKNTKIPCTRKALFSTVTDFQRQVQVGIYQGDSEWCRDNELVAKFIHEISAPGPAGQPVEIEMSYNLDGMVDVVARDPESGHRTAVRIMPDGVVHSEEELRIARERMARDSGAAPTHCTDAAPAAPTNSATGGSTPSSTPSADPFGTNSSDWRTAPLYPRVAALLNHADGRLAELSGTERVRINRTVNELRAALIANDAAVVQAKEDELTDALFELD